MYIDVDSCGFVSLMQMNTEESEALASMIRSAGLSERRTFNKVLQQLEKEAGVRELEKELLMMLPSQVTVFITTGS